MVDNAMLDRAMVDRAMGDAAGLFSLLQLPAFLHPYTDKGSRQNSRGRLKFWNALKGEVGNAIINT